MQCSQCNNSNFISINERLFCADCGIAARERLQNFNPDPKTAVTPPRVAASNTLDLSNKRQAKTNPVQSIHGIRKPPLESTSQSTKEPAQDISSAVNVVIPPPAAIQTKKPSAPRLDIAKSDHIKRFHFDNQATTPETLEETPETPDVEPLPLVTHMTPHRTYQVTPLEEEIAAGIAQHHERRPQFASTQLDAMIDNPLPSQTKQRFGFFKSLFSSRLSSGLAIGLSILVLSGYVTYLNYPNIALRVAASRANLAADMPGFIPSGYKFSGPISYSSGQLTLNFYDGDKSLALKQRQTQWDSESLLESFVKPVTSKYQIFQKNGLTVYVYDNNQATWVNGGIWYTLESNSFLNSEEIIKMASSL